jgi:hypothetical protein
MKSEKDENDKSNCLIKKLKTNINKAISPQERFNSTYKQRPYTSMKIKKQDFDGKANFTKNNFYIPKLSKAFFASKNQTHNLYYNKHSFIWGKSKMKNINLDNKYYAQEELVDRVLKLKKALNKLNNQNTEQKIILNKQKKELKKQNKILNEVQKKYFFEKFYHDENMSQDNYDSGIGYMDQENKLKISKSFPKNGSFDEIRNRPNNNISNNIIINNFNNNNINKKNRESQDNIDFISSTGIKEMYKKMVLQNERKDQEIVILKDKLDHNKLSNDANISNIKIQFKKLKDELEKKNEEIIKLKKNSKCTKFNEIMKEKEVYENEMINIKSKFNKAIEAQEKNRIYLKKIKYLIEEMNIKDSKIEHLENKLKLITKNLEDNIQYLKNEINKKEKRIIKLENENKKLNIKVLSFENPPFWKRKKNIKEIKLEIYNNNFSIISKFNKKEEKRKSEEYNDFENINNEDKIKNKENYVNHNLNFSEKTNVENSDKLLNKKDSEKDIIKDESKNINVEKEDDKKNKDNNIENDEQNKENIENKSINQENWNEFPELFLIYIELKKKNINTDSFINELFTQLNPENSLNDNKKIYFDYLVKFFNISDDEGNKTIENLINKEFSENKLLENIKNHHIEVFKRFAEDENNKNENEKDFMKQLKKIDENKLKNIIKKYDDIQIGIVYFNQMISIIKEINMEKYLEKILLLTKDNVFNLINYQNLLDIISKKQENNKIENESETQNKNNDLNSEKKESKILLNQDQEKNDEENKDKNNESSSLKKYEEDFDFIDNEKNSKSNENNENIINKDKEFNENSDVINIIDTSEKILKNLAHFIVIEGSTPNLYISSLKEEKNSINVINAEKLFEFIEEKNIQINDKEKEEIINKYGIEIDEKDNEKYIDHDKLSEKLFEYMKNDDGISNDEDFMKNIKSLDIDGID